jgi:hypothetical protein
MSILKILKSCKKLTLKSRHPNINEVNRWEEFLTP